MSIRVIPSRASDPETSHEAEKSISVGREHLKMLRMFADGEEYNAWEAMTRSPDIDPESCYWKRCSDLKVSGHLTWTGEKRPGRNNRMREVYAITTKGLTYLEENDV